ncbi:hypothetical protein CFOL_v3_25641 [Cephalotus follicularis]|uniref:Uncharacterized protein n=1 Tax=Cephalotus follicularis TaxID=3775 RepID=A0A1Q3CPL1_CEPFO|nr:hypothetical protein CFOL_v3_25641 [Cephalotus follicularis]
MPLFPPFLKAKNAPTSLSLLPLSSPTSNSGDGVTIGDVIATTRTLSPKKPNPDRLLSPTRRHSSPSIPISSPVIAITRLEHFVGFLLLFALLSFLFASSLDTVLVVLQIY